MSREGIEFTVNGKKCVVQKNISITTSLNAYLRYTLALPGTKAMCHEGGCGACVVAVRARRQPSGRVELFSVNSCLVLVFSCHGWDITTVEALGDRRHGYDDIQKRITAFNATQCGYCTPGWAMHLYSLQDKCLTMEEMEQAFASNTCRCTGFRPILDTVKSFAVDASSDLCQKVTDIEELDICSKTKANCERKCSLKSIDSDWSVLVDDTPKPEAAETVAVYVNNNRFFKVYFEEDIFRILEQYGVNSYMLIDGNTSKGIYEDFEYPQNLIDISSVKSLKVYSFDQNLVLGANISLEDCIEIFKDTSKTKSEFAYLKSFAKHLDKAAHMPVRKIGSIAGNLMIKHRMPSYPSDVFLLLETVGAVLIIRNSRRQRTVLNMLEFLQYDMVGQLIISVELPPLSPEHIFTSYKIMPRNQNASAVVNAGFLVKKDPKTHIISNARLVYGNVSAGFVHATRTENFLKGQNVFNNDMLQKAISVLSKELVPEGIAIQPSKETRKKLAIGLFYKFILSIAPSNLIKPQYRSGASLITRPVSKGTQDYQTDSSLYPLNQPVLKLEAMIQGSGEAQYANDVPLFPNEVFGAFVLSNVHSGQVDSINVEKIMKTDGVLALYTAKDIPGKNSFTHPDFLSLSEDEEILATKIKFHGQPIAIVVAITEELAARAAKKVEVTYKNTSSSLPVLTIDEAKKDSKRYTNYPEDNIKPKGRGYNVTKVIKGVYEVETQYHYHIEPITCVVVPVDTKLEVFDATQWPDLTQTVIAQCLGEKVSDIVIKCRRIGGSFGGKISRNAQAAAACALVARKMNAPARFILPLHTNMSIAGRRKPIQCDYEVGVDDDGKIQYLNATIVEDEGCSHNDNVLKITSKAFSHCYTNDYFSLTTAAVLTDLPSSSYVRAPGSTEGIASIEHIMEHIAFTVKKDPTEVRKINMRVEDNDLPTLIDEFKEDTNYDRRAKDIEQFNKANRWMKKAIKISLMIFSVMYHGNLNGMVSIYRTDGSVTVTTGGIEMGQGLNTKVAQVCAYELGIPLEYVSVLPVYSFSSANNMVTAGSVTSESACYAVIKACQMLKERLEPIKAKMTNPTWQELVKQAGDEQVDLTGLYMMTNKDLPAYSAFAVAILETQLDVLTGRYELLRVDILEDVGLSANPILDVGQVEGAYVQGLGYFTSEKFVYDKTTGRLLTNRSRTYHVPLALDIPAHFGVKLRYNSKNRKGVLGSKAVGEMGVCTAHGVTHALRQCIHASRADSGHDPDEWINIYRRHEVNDCEAGAATQTRVPSASCYQKPVPYDTEAITKALDVKLDEMLLS